jgi:hypothetical protein
MGGINYLKVLYFSLYVLKTSVTMAPSMVRLLIAASPLRDICLLWDSRAGQPSVDNLNLRRALNKPHSLPLYHVKMETVEMYCTCIGSRLCSASLCSSRTSMGG